MLLEAHFILLPGQGLSGGSLTQCDSKDPDVETIEELANRARDTFLEPANWVLDCGLWLGTTQRKNVVPFPRRYSTHGVSMISVMRTCKRVASCKTKWQSVYFWLLLVSSNEVPSADSFWPFVWCPYRVSIKVSKVLQCFTVLIRAM